MREVLAKAGFVPGRSSPNILHYADKDIWTFAHGDDVCSSAEPESMAWLDDILRKAFLVKTVLVGPGPDMHKDARILNRLISWDDRRGLRYEADPRHAEIIVQQTGVGTLKPLSAPGTKVRSRPGTTTTIDDETDEDKLNDILLRARRARWARIVPATVGTFCPLLKPLATARWWRAAITSCPTVLTSGTG